MGFSAKKESQEISRRSKGSNLWRNKGKEDLILKKKKKMWVAAENCVCIWLLNNATTRAIRKELLSWYREILKNKFIKLGRRKLYKYSNARETETGFNCISKIEKKTLNKELLCQKIAKAKTAKINWLLIKSLAFY